MSNTLMRQPLSPIAHVAYQDLLRSLKDEALSDVRGAPVRVVRGAKAYWYDSFRLGGAVQNRYIGEESEELLARLDRAKASSARQEDGKRHRQRLIRILRAEGLLGVDVGTGALLAAMERIGVFRLGGTLVGTQAFRLYEGELGVRLTFDQMAQTRDIDLASFERLSLALGDQVLEPVQNVLGALAFDPVPTLERGQVWRWRQVKSEALVEFLTPSFDETEGLKPLAALGVHAQALHHLNYLIAEPIKAAVTYRSGVLVQIPRPERFAVHKLIVADRRSEGPDRSKAPKDRAQAAFLIDVLAEDRPDDLAEAMEDALASGPRWRERIAASLARMPQTRERLIAAGAAPP